MKTNQPSLVERINTAIQESAESDRMVPVGRGPEFIPARTYFSQMDVNENDITLPSPLTSFHPGSNRMMFSVYDQQHASVPVTAITASGNTQSNQLALVQGGLSQNPIAPSGVWSVVPSNITSIRTQGPVMIQANVSVKSSATNDTAAFAIYRDGNLLGNHLTHTTPAVAGSTTAVQIMQMDNPPPGQHVYAMYWSPGSGTLTAVSNYRNLNVINLFPQG